MVVRTNGSTRRGGLAAAGGAPGRRGRLVFAAGDDAIPSLDLGLIKELVDPLQEIGARLARAEPRNAERRRHLAHPLAARLDCPLFGLQNPPYPLDGADRIGEPRARKDQREFLAA